VDFTVCLDLLRLESFTTQMRGELRTAVAEHVAIDLDFVSITSVRESVKVDVSIYIPEVLAEAAAILTDGGSLDGDDAPDPSKVLTSNPADVLAFYSALDAMLKLTPDEFGVQVFASKPTLVPVPVVCLEVITSPPDIGGSLKKLRRLIESISTDALDCVCPDTRSTRKLGAAAAPAHKRASSVRQLLFGGVLDKPLCEPSLCL